MYAYNLLNIVHRVHSIYIKFVFWKNGNLFSIPTKESDILREKKKLDIFENMAQFVKQGISHH